MKNAGNLMMIRFAVVARIYGECLVIQLTRSWNGWASVFQFPVRCQFETQLASIGLNWLQVKLFRWDVGKVLEFGDGSIRFLDIWNFRGISCNHFAFLQLLKKGHSSILGIARNRDVAADVPGASPKSGLVTQRPLKAIHRPFQSAQIGSLARNRRTVG